MQTVLYVSVVLAGVLVPFFIKNDKDVKEKILHYLVVLADIGVLIIASIMGYISILGRATIEGIIIGIMIVSLGCLIAKMTRMVNYKKESTTKNHKTAA
jgi:hypothetical protein